MDANGFGDRGNRDVGASSAVRSTIKTIKWFRFSKSHHAPADGYTMVSLRWSRATGLDLRENFSWKLKPLQNDF